MPFRPDGIIIKSSSMKKALLCHKRDIRCLTDLDSEPEKNILWASQLRLLTSEAFLNFIPLENTEFFELNTGLQTGCVGFENGPLFLPERAQTVVILSRINGLNRESEKNKESLYGKRVIRMHRKHLPKPDGRGVVPSSL